MTHTQSTKLELPGVQAELERHELRYAERKLVQSGKSVAALRSVLQRQEPWLGAFGGLLLHELASVFFNREHSIVAAISEPTLGSVCWYGLELIVLAWAFTHWRSARRCRAAIEVARAGELAEARHDAR